jgi:lipoyl(octanoyl) transferase
MTRTERTERTEREPQEWGSTPSSPPCPTFFLWIDETPRPGWANMAIDQALLERAERQGESWLRLYRWAPFCLSFGRHEPATRRYAQERITALGVDTVRRPTGGRAVWHAQELTYAVAAPSFRFGSLRAAYLEIHHMLADALRGLGVPASLAPSARTPALDAGACFSQPAGGEIMVRGRKVVGSAQYRQGTALLQHGSILLEDNQGFVRSIMRGARLSDPTLGEATSQASLEAPDVAEAVARAARSRWDGTWTPASGVESVLPGARKYHVRFRSPMWTWAR